MKIISTLILLCATTQFAIGQTRAEKLDSICSEIHANHQEVGMSIGFIDSGKVDYFNYGNLSRESERGVDENSIYEIGSITKLFTAHLLAQAQCEGKLAVDDFIDAYLPSDFLLSENIKDKLRISDLATHQSGLPDLDFEKLLALNPTQPLNISKETIHSLINDSTELSDYGTYRYCNLGYVLLGMILETAYAKSFDELIKEKILEPAKMAHTYTTDFDAENSVTGYDLKGVEQEYFDWNDLAAPAGLLKSNASDMVKFLEQLLADEGAISEATAITETTFYKTALGEVGFGQIIERHGDDTFFYKTGDTFACSSILAYDKETNWGIVILINQHNSDLIRELINTNYEQVFGQK